MGGKQRWTPDEEQALRDGVERCASDQRRHNAVNLLKPAAVVAKHLQGSLPA